MNLVRFDPFQELEAMSSRLNQVFTPPMLRRTTNGDTALFADWAPALDVQETDKEYLVKTDLPEVKKEDVKIGIQDGMLTLEGDRKQEKEEKGKKFHRVERSYGSFMRRLVLPADVDQQKIAAEFKDGVLIVHLPKMPSAMPKTIDVKVM
jgi:HSP20 family protein